MSMVSYYNPAAMYRHQQAATQPSFHHSATAPMHPHSWYGGYHHQGGQPGTTGSVASTPSYCMQDEQQMWHTHSHSAMAFHNDFGTATHDLAAAAVAAAHGMPGSGMHHQHHHHQLDLPENQLPSPPITVSGSELSSPGGAGGSVTPPNPTAKTRPAPARSPYDWINKPSYQSQPNPGKTRTKDKYRVVYSDHQRVELEKEFYYSRYITIRRKAELASTLGLSERQVKIWFQNRRAKERKQVKKRDEFTNEATTSGSSNVSGTTTTTMGGKHHLIQFTNHDLHHFPFTEVSTNGLLIDGHYGHPTVGHELLETALYDNHERQQLAVQTNQVQTLEPLNSVDIGSKTNVIEQETEEDDDEDDD